MSDVLGSIFGFGDKMKRRLRDAAFNPRDYLEMTAGENQNEWKRDPTERSMGFFNPVPLGNVSKFVLRKQMKEAIDELPSLSRRDFMKKSAGIAGGTAAASIPGAKLLQKFAPEERAAVKQAAVEAAPKYKYNSLKEYLDDVEQYSQGRYFDDMADVGFESGRRLEPDAGRIIREKLLQDEQMYNQAKQNAKQGLKPAPYEVQFDKNGNAVTTEWADAFSPQAKKEMKEWKNYSESMFPVHGTTGRNSMWNEPELLEAYTRDIKLWGEPQF